jgi:hypothetical protein
MGQRMSYQRRGWFFVSASAATIAASLFMLSASSRGDSEFEDTTLTQTRAHHQEGSAVFQITTVSSRNDLISGGNALVRIGVAAHIPLSQVAVTLNGAAATSAFQEESPGSHSLIGLVSGLRNGDNHLDVRQVGHRGGPTARLELTNYPITGPVLSGPHLTPYECGTVQSGLGAPLDADCSAATRIDYFYRTSANTFAPLVNPTGPRPADLVFTTTNEGHTVPYIVRVESGTNNRSIYRIAMLDNPTGALFTPGPGWNHKLVVNFGGGCSALYNQGTNQATNALSNLELSNGFAYAISTELVNGQHCNAYLQGEALMMLKEHFIKTYGQPKWTLGKGGSGGAIQQYEITQIMPGLLDGLQPSISFPDTQLDIFDCPLLKRVYNSDPATWTTAKQVAVNGYGPTQCESWIASFTSLVNPTTGNSNPPCGLSDQTEVYNPISNPTGARCDIYAMIKNVLGINEETGFARRPLDNVGVQYGLLALNSGMINKTEFLVLNQNVGGFDIDGNNIPQRTVGDREAIARGYASGIMNGGAGGLPNVPILTQRQYLDPFPGANIHNRFEDFVIRARLERANGRSDNQIIWTVPITNGNLPAMSLDLMNRWLDAIASDPTPLSIDKVVRDKPTDAVDACWDANGNEIVEKATLTGPSKCNALYPIFSHSRVAAGGPLTDDIYKCRLKPIDFRDYAVTFTDAEKAQLRSIFPHGVCDYAESGEDQQPLFGTYLRVSLERDWDNK